MDANKIKIQRDPEHLSKEDSSKKHWSKKYRNIGLRKIGLRLLVWGTLVLRIYV